MALSNITLSTTKSNISVDVTNTIVNVGQTVSNVTLAQAISSRFIEDVYTVGASTGNVSIDLSNGTIQNLTQTGDITGFNFTNLDSGASITLVIVQDGIGGHTLDTTTYTSNWTSWEFVNNYTTFDTNPSNYNIINLFNNGTKIYASLLTEISPPVQNGDLANSNITVNGTVFNLGDTGNIANFGPLTTNDLTEGNTNLYYTDTRSREAVSVSSSAGLLRSNGTLTYDNSTGVFSFTSAGVPQTTSDLPEGSNQYYTSTKVDNAIGNYTGGLTNLTGNIITTGNIVTTANVTCNNIITTDQVAGTGTFDTLVIPRGGLSNNIIVGGDGGNEPGFMSNVNIQNLTQMRFNSPGNDTLMIQAKQNQATFGRAIGESLTIQGGTLNTWSTGHRGLADPGCSNIYLVMNPVVSGDRNGQSPQANNVGGILHTGFIYNTGNVARYPNITNDASRENAYTGTDILDIRSVGNITFRSGAIHDDTVLSNITMNNSGIHLGYQQYYFGDGSQLTNLPVVSNTQVQTFIQENGLAMTNTITSDSNISTTGVVTFGNSATQTHNFTGNLDVTGNITATGNLNYQNVTDLYVTDQKITLNANAATDATVEIIANRPVAGANTVLRWNETDDKWQFSNDGSTYQNLIGLTDFSVTTNTPSGNGSLSYSNTTGVFTFTPADVPDTTDELTEGSTNLYFTDARANTVIGTNTTDNLTEGATNLYYTDARSRAAVSVTQASASGNGTLSYDNGTGVFTYTPPDLTGAGLTNAQAQAYIQSNGLTMTADITSSNLIGTTGNLDLNSSTAVDNLYGLKWDSAVNKFISSPNAGTTAPDYLFTIEKESTDLEAIRSRIARAGAFGWKENYEKASGTLSSPTAFGDYDETWQQEHHGHDGTNGYGGPDGNASMGFHVFQDAQTASVSANIVPMAYEIYGGLNGAIEGTFNSSFMSIHSDGKIVFNDTGGVRGFNTKTGTANISRDGSIVSAADITSRANIVAEANINAAGGTLTGVLTSNSDIGTSGNISIGGYIASGTYILGNGSQLTGLATSQITDFSSEANTAIATNLAALTSNIDTTASINFTADTGDESIIKVVADTPSAGTNILDVTSARSADAGSYMIWKKATGSIASPGAIGTRDFVVKEEYYGHDGTDYLETFGMFVYQDNSSITGGSVSANVVPLAMEFYCEQGGDVNHGFNQSIMRMTPARSIEFNDTGTRTFGQGYGNANITMDGTINSESDIKAGNAVFTDNIFSYTPGGTFTMNAVRVTDFKANDPLNIDSTANSNLSGGVYAAPFTGAIVYVTGDRHGARGAPAYFDGTSWRYFSDDANVTI